MSKNRVSGDSVNKKHHQSKLNPASKQRMAKVNQIVQSTLRQTVNMLGWSDSEVAKYSGQPQSTIYRLLNARTTSPPFGLVYDVCQTLRIPLPLSNQIDDLIRPVRWYLGCLGKVSSGANNETKTTEYVHVLPKLKSLSVGKIMDDCADRRYPKKSLLFISDQERDLAALKEDDSVIVQITETKGEHNIIIPMTIVRSPDCDEWILYHMSNNKNKHRVYNVNKISLRGDSNDKIIHVIGFVQNALI